jgi:hypothetical protein
VQSNQAALDIFFKKPFALTYACSNAKRNITMMLLAGIASGIRLAPACTRSHFPRTRLRSIADLFIFAQN